MLHWFLRLLDCVKAFSCMIRRQQRVAFIIYTPTLRIFWCWFAAGASPPNSCYLRKLAGERWLHIRYGTNKNTSKSHILMWLYKHANLDYIHALKKKKGALCVPLHLAVLWYFHLLNDLAEGSTWSNCYCGNKPNLLSKSCFYIWVRQCTSFINYTYIRCSRILWRRRILIELMNHALNLQNNLVYFCGYKLCDVQHSSA